MKTTEPSGPPEERPSAGQDFVRRIGPAGCVLFLALAVLVAAVCLTAGRNPIPGYEPPHDTAYWAAHPAELAAELNENVLPRLEHPARAEAADGKVVVTIDKEYFVTIRGAILRYFDESVIDFERGAVS